MQLRQVLEREYRRPPSVFAMSCALAMTLLACGGEAPQSAPTATERPSTEAAASVPEPTTGSGAREIAVPAEPPLAGIDPAAWTYDMRVDNIVFLLDAYWSEALPDRFDTEYSPPERIVAYDSEESDPGCLGEPQGAANAYYCEPDDLIAWDDANLIEPLDADLGEDAMTFVIAHEWAHLIQERLGLIYEYPVTVEKELAADCLAGDFLGALAEQVGMTKREFRSIVGGLVTFGDPKGVPWTDPTAHGNPRERGEALDVGFTNGAEACLEVFAPEFSS